MPWFPNPSGGPPIQADTNPNPAGGSYGSYSDPSYTGPPPPTGGGGAPPSTPGAPPTQNTGAAQLASGINSLLGAIASGNKQAFDEAVRQFNTTFGLDQDKFNESVRQFNQNYLISQAGVTGTYNGQQTQQAQLQAANIAAQQAGLTGYYVAPGTAGAGGNIALDAFTTKASPGDQQTYLNATGGDRNAAANRYWQDVQGAIAASGQSPQLFVYGAQGAPSAAGVPTLVAQNQWATLFGQNAAPTAGQTTLAAQQQAYAQQMGAINAAAALQANPFRQAQVIGQAGRVLQGLPTAGFQAPNVVAGVGTAGGNTQGGMGYLQQLIDDIKSPQANQTTAQSWLDATPTPNKLDSVSFLRSSPTTQNLILQAQQEKYGIDPQDSLKQIQNTMPQFAAPNTVGTVRRG